MKKPNRLVVNGLYYDLTEEGRYVATMFGREYPLSEENERKALLDLYGTEAEKRYERAAPNQSLARGVGGRVGDQSREAHVINVSRYDSVAQRKLGN
jgi:hypothetical protein